MFVTLKLFRKQFQSTTYSVNAGHGVKVGPGTRVLEPRDLGTWDPHHSLSIMFAFELLCSRQIIYTMEIIFHELSAF